MMAESYRKLTRHTSWKITPGEPNELRRCPEVEPSCGVRDSTQIRRRLPNVGQHWPNLGQTWSTLGQTRPKFQIGQMLPMLAPMLANNCLMSANFGQRMADIGQAWPTLAPDMLAKGWPDVGHTRPNFSPNRPRCWAELRRLPAQLLGHFWYFGNCSATAGLIWTAKGNFSGCVSSNFWRLSGG